MGTLGGGYMALGPARSDTADAWYEREDVTEEEEEEDRHRESEELTHILLVNPTGEVIEKLNQELDNVLKSAWYSLQALADTKGNSDEDNIHQNRHKQCVGERKS